MKEEEAADSSSERQASELALTEPRAPEARFPRPRDCEDIRLCTNCRRQRHAQKVSRIADVTRNAIELFAEQMRSEIENGFELASEQMRSNNLAEPMHAQQMSDAAIERLRRAIEPTLEMEVQSAIERTLEMETAELNRIYGSAMPVMPNHGPLPPSSTSTTFAVLTPRVSLNPEVQPILVDAQQELREIEREFERALAELSRIYGSETP